MLEIIIWLLDAGAKATESGAHFIIESVKSLFGKQETDETAICDM